MKPDNLNRLNILLNQNIKDGYSSHDITNPTYSSLYLNIFFDEIKDGQPLHSDRFSEKLELTEGTAEVQDQVCEKFVHVWDA